MGLGHPNRPGRSSPPREPGRRSGRQADGGPVREPAGVARAVLGHVRPPHAGRGTGARSGRDGCRSAFPRADDSDDRRGSAG